MTPLNKQPQTPDKQQKALEAAQRLLENNLLEAAQSMLDSAGLKHIIKNGRIISEDDVTEDYLDKFITVNTFMLEVKKDIRKLTSVDDPVLIIGPTGTGKELLANALHGKRTGKFQSCNAAGLPENLVESELFGHVRGAFTGAHELKHGLITRAKNGTFFLDEIGELPLEAQAKLLRVIQDRKLRKVGGSEDEDVSCRFVFATNKDIRQMCEQGKFRLDLYARISTFELRTLGLSSRPEDIEPIVKSYEGGKELWDKIQFIQSEKTGQPIPMMDLSFNVRSIQQHIKRYKILGKLP